MPFDSTTAPAAGRKGGPKRWSGKDPSTKRDRAIHLVISQNEYGMILGKAAEANLSNTEMIVQAVKNFKPDGKRESNGT